jgi:hypothetical protein
MPADLPAEAELLALAARFVDAERRVRALLAEAVAGGDRRALLTEALQILVELRRFALRASPMLERAYEAAFLAVAVLVGRPELRPSSEASYDLARSLTGRLDRAARTAQEGSRTAFATAAAATLAVASQDAVTALVDRAGHRLSLGGYAAGVTRQAGRVAVSTATAAALGDGLVTISTHGTVNPICVPLEGVTLPASGNLPPYHAGCQHVATPAGFTIGELAAAQAEAIAAG